MEHHPKHCLNCHTPLTGKFCTNCGQKADTHRLSLKHFFLHDMVHGLWHLDKGILFSLKEIILRPGKTARNYIAGKRVGHFNIVTLLLLLLGVIFFLASFNIHSRPAGETGPNAVNDWVHHNAKWLLLSFIPVMALWSLVFYRKGRYNYAEHLLINSYFFVGILILFNVLLLISYMSDSYPFVLTMNLLFFVSVLFFGGLTYWQVFHDKYSVAGFLWRYVLMLAVILASILAIGITGIIISSYFTADKSMHITL